MASRITLIDPATDYSAATDTSPQWIKQDHAQQIIRAGIVTHKIRNPDEVDALFAVSQARDLPEVSFVAAFEDGLILLGCPDGPPDCLVEMVEPVSADTGPPEHSPDLSAKLDVLTARIDKLDTQTDDRISAGLERVVSVSQRLEYIADALGPDNGSAASEPLDFGPVLAALKDSMDGIHARMSEAHVPDQNAQFAAMEARFDALSAHAAKQTDRMQAALDNVTSGLRALTEQRESGQSLTAEHVTDALDPVVARVGGLQTSVARLDERLQQVGTSIQTKDTDVAQLAQAVSAMHATAMNPPAAVDAERLDHLAGEIAGLKADWAEAASKGHQAIKKINDFSSQLTDLAQNVVAQTGVADIGADLAAANSRIEEIALGTQAISTRLESETTDTRIEALTQKLDAVLQDRPESDPGKELATPLADLQERVAALPEHITDGLETRLTGVVEQRLERLQQDIKRLGKQPAPVVDLTEQRRAFANFTVAMSSVTQRLEAAAESIGGHVAKQNQAELPQDILDRVDALPDRIRDILPPTADLSALENRLDAFGDTLTNRVNGIEATVTAGFSAIETAQFNSFPDAIADLRSDVQALAQRPPVQLDLTAQRESFARFGTAMATVVKRLEDAIATLGSLQQGSHVENVELLAVVQALPRALHEAVEDARNRDPVQQTVAEVHETLKQMATEVADFRAMQDLLDTLARRPDPVPDMSEQRRGFARFATAMGTAIQRLEQVSDRLHDTGPDAGNGPDIEEVLQAIQSEIGTLAAAHSRHANELDTRLAELSDHTCDGARGPSTAQLSAPFASSVPKGHVSLDEMRFMFAELVATQIRDNANRVPVET
ncbi:MAG: hypothetical protein AAFP16_18970 [Pseudomonadota bacterium]